MAVPGVIFADRCRAKSGLDCLIGTRKTVKAKFWIRLQKFFRSKSSPLPLGRGGLGNLRVRPRRGEEGVGGAGRHFGRAACGVEDEAIPGDDLRAASAHVAALVPHVPHHLPPNPQFQNNCFTEMCNGSEAGLCLQRFRGGLAPVGPARERERVERETTGYERDEREKKSRERQKGTSPSTTRGSSCAARTRPPAPRVLNFRTTNLHKCAAVPRRTRI